MTESPWVPHDRWIFLPNLPDAEAPIIAAATSLDLTSYVDEVAADNRAFAAAAAAPEQAMENLWAPIYAENGDLSRESTEDALARIDAELEAWEDMSTAARWTPPPNEDELPSSGVVEWLERVCDDLELTDHQRLLLEHYYAVPTFGPTNAIIVTHG